MGKRKSKTSSTPSRNSKKRKSSEKATTTTKRPKRVQILSPLSKLNGHPRNKRVFFDEEPHLYYIDGSSEGVISVTTMIKEHYTGFNGPKGARTMLTNPKQRWLDNDNWDLLKPLIDDYLTRVQEEDENEAEVLSMFVQNVLKQQTIDLDEIDTKQYMRWRTRLDDWTSSDLYKELLRETPALWSQKGQKAAAKGTAMHLNFHNYLNGLDHDWEAVTLKQLMNFQADHPHLVIHETEVTYWCKGALLSGNADSIWKDMKTGKYVIVDWKRTLEVKSEGFCACRGGHDPEVCDRDFHAPFDHLENCDYNKYALQNSVYRVLVEDHYGIEVQETWNVLCHEDLDNYIKIVNPDLTKEARQMIDMKKDARRRAKGTPSEPEPDTNSAMGFELEQLASDQVKKLTISKTDGKHPVLRINDSHPNLYVFIDLLKNNEILTTLEPTVLPTDQNEISLKVKIPMVKLAHGDNSRIYSLKLRMYTIHDTEHPRIYGSLRSNKFKIHSHSQYTKVRRHPQTQLKHVQGTK